MTDRQTLKVRARDFFAELQDEICAALETLDGSARFREDLWVREEGGGGRTRILEGGALFEKAGVNFSEVDGRFDQAFAAKMPVGEGSKFFATGISLVLHPSNPFVPTVHANFRYLEDVIHFHGTLKEACDKFDPWYYPRLKKWCDEYFLIKHRNEARGVGGIFFDYLTGKHADEPLDAGDTRPSIDRGIEFVFEFVRGVGRAFLPAYVPIAEKRRGEPFTEREREFQLIRRGRYVEFNLVYDRGTHFGLQTRGRTESILMSLPPVVRWEYDYHPEPGSREAEAWEFFHPRDWLKGSERAD